MATLNKAILIGYVGKEPDVRYLETPEHPKVAQFSLATTERMKSKDGEVKELTEWHNIVAGRSPCLKIENIMTACDFCTFRGETMCFAGLNTSTRIK